MLAILIQSIYIAGTAHALVTSKLTGTIISNSQLTLKWTDNLKDEKQYILERKTDGGGVENRLIFSYPDITSCTDSYESGHTYTYRVKVMDADNNVYIYTDEIIFRPGDVEAPDSLVVTPVTSSQIDIKWGYPNNKAYNTIVERKIEGDTTWLELARVGIGQNTYSDRSIASGVRYYYRVKAYSSDSVTTLAYPESGSAAYTLLFKPTDPYGFALSPYQIQLSWKDNSIETAFIIERKSPDDGVFKQIAVVPQNINTYIDSDSNLKPNTTYAYRIKAVTGVTASEYSDTINITTTYMKPPGNLTSSCSDGKSVQLQWQDFTDNETGFEIWRRIGVNSNWELYESMGRNATTFTDLSVSLENSYSYKIRAKINNNSAYSDFSNETTVWSSTITAPANLTYESVSKNTIKLSWEDTSNIEIGFRVERRLGLSGEWYTIAYLEPNTVTFNDIWINDTDVYYYRIKVLDRANSVNYSNELMVSLKKPQAPSMLSASTLSSNEVLLTWKDNSSNESQFVIEIMQYYYFREVGRVSQNTTYFICKDLNPDRTMTFRVRAVSGVNQSDPSNEVVAVTKKKVTYSDLGGVSWAVEAINSLGSRNVFDILPDTSFYPTQKVTKGEYCAIVLRSLDLIKSSAGSYSDVNSRHRYYKELMSAAKLGIVAPDKNNRLYPDSTITREQAGNILALAMKAKGTPLPYSDSSVLKQFTDYKSMSAASAEKIAAVYGAGLMSGKIKSGKPYLDLSSSVTRAEAAVMAYKAINLN